MDTGQLGSTPPSRQSRILSPTLNEGLDEWAGAEEPSYFLSQAEAEGRAGSV